MKEKCKKEKSLMLEWIFAILIAIIMLYSFVYIDIESLTIWTTNFWDVIADGDITQYFAYTAENIHNVTHQYVSGTLYSLIPWAIWNLPIWIMQRYFHIPIISNSLMIVWSALFLVLCTIAVVKLVQKITFELTKDKEISKLAAFLTFSSVWVYVGVFYAGQNDIMICLLGLLALYALLKKRTKLFLLAAGFAISVKYFFIFPFIALVLLTEKNIYKIIGKIIVGILPTLLFYAICRGLPMFLESSQSGPLSDMFTQLFTIGILGFAVTNVSLFALGLVYVYFTSYITVPKEEEYNKFVIYTTVIGFVPLLMFTQIQFYRLIIIIPFLIILLLQNRKMLKINLILESIMEVTTLIVIIFNMPNIFSPAHAAYGIIPNALNLNVNTMSLGKEILKLCPELKGMIPAFSAIAVATMIILMVINHPRFKDNWIDYKEEKFARGLLWVRPLAISLCLVGVYYIMR